MLPRLKIKTVLWAALLTTVAAGAWHYRSVIAKNTELVARVLVLQSEKDELTTAVRREREAAREAVAQREAAQRALDTLRRSRVEDTEPEFVEWAAQRLPPTERARICAALPEAAGCD